MLLRATECTCGLLRLRPPREHITIETTLRTRRQRSDGTTVAAGIQANSRGTRRMIFPRWLLFTLAALSTAGAFAVAVLIACSRPSVAGLVELLILPALLVTNAFVLYAIACFSGEREDGGPDHGGTGKAGIDPPERPTGGIALDWETFEAEFRTYADRHVGAHR